MSEVPSSILDMEKAKLPYIENMIAYFPNYS